MAPLKSYAYIFTLAVCTFAGSGCKKDNISLNPQKEPIIKGPEDSVAPLRPFITGRDLNINDLNIFIPPNGIMTNRWDFAHAGNAGTSIAEAVLWLGVDDVTPAEISSYNYSCVWDSMEHGIYDVTSSNVSYAGALGLTDLGFPADDSRQPKLLGDEMLWLSLNGKTDTRENLTSNPVKDVRVSMSAFAYKRADLKNVLFLRFDIKNTGSKDLSKVYGGYRSDTDVGAAFNNSTGYMLDEGFTYTYVAPRYYKYETDSMYKQVCGFTFLKAPLEGSGIPFGITSHRICRKNNYINPEFGEYDVGLQESVNGLKGLSNDGKPMIDPTTGQNTMYAFTGDPVSNTGWLDTPVDTRNMINTGPFALKAGETKTVVVLWVYTAETTLKGSLQKAKDQLEQIRSQRSLWE
ncbi:MAG TPA: hypothetical protein VHO03_20385 [Ignavibacteriales bacterium]|nr:hypothetical protein [Ignavibacteriales bacterium]